MRLSYYWLPVLEVAKKCIQQPDEAYETVIARLKSEIEQVGAKALSVGFTQNQILSAQFAIVACIDELAISSHWQGKSTWIKKPLQLFYFSTTRAGADFFVKANEAGNDAAVKEVYALVLLSGYTGIYQGPQDPKLKKYRNNYLKELTEQLDMKPLSEDINMFPESRSPHEKNGSHFNKYLKPNNRSLLAVIFVPLLCLAAIYLYFSLQISHMANEKIEAVSPVFQKKK